MVMARELTLKQVGDIVKAIEKNDIRGPKGELVQVEIFAHGALCMAVSGKCYLSLHSHNASANRGACIQNCRREYTVTDEEGIELKNYPLYGTERVLLSGSVELRKASDGIFN